MSNTNQVIINATITKRINNAATNFTINYSTPLSPADFACGKSFDFIVDDPTLSESFVAISGIVESISRDGKDNNKIYSLSGRDMGRLLVKQPFKWDCTDSLGASYTVGELLSEILEDTGLEVGRGQEPLDKAVKLNTYSNSLERFCGEWATKEDALNQLFNQYMKIAGGERFRWYVDNAGYFRWFEINSDRAGKMYIFDDDQRITDFTVKEDATNIMNSITGVYGTGDTQATVTRTANESIGIYGLCPGSPVREDFMTESQMIEKLDSELDQKAIPIYSATVTMSGFYDIEPGQQIIFPNDPYYPSIVFTVVDWTFQLEPANPQTILNLTTDESVISIPNEFEIIQAVAQHEVNEAKVQVGTVTSVDGDWVTVDLENGKGSVKARYVEFGWG